MQLNQFASSTTPLDMTATDEFRSLLASAQDLGLDHDSDIRYVSRNVVVRHLRLNVLEWGPEDAPPVVLLHGGHQSAHSWDLVSLCLARDFRVIAPDQRGHGDSEWVRSAHYSNHEMAADALALMDELGLERPLLMGHSMGGRNALLAALAAPQRLRALVAVDIGPEVSEKGRRTIASFVAANEEFEDLDAFVANVQRYDPYRSREHIERTVRYNLFQRADGRYISKCDRLPRKLGLTQQFDPAELTLERVASLPMPALVVRGANSTILEADAAARFAGAISRGELVTVPDCGHNVHSQNTPGFLAATRAFLARHAHA